MIRPDSTRGAPRGESPGESVLFGRMINVVQVSRFAILPCVALALGLAGCEKAPPAQFRLNMQDIIHDTPDKDPFEFVLTGGEKDEAEVKDKEARRAGLQKLTDALAAFFGTPDDPYVVPESGLDAKKVRLASGPYGGNADGTQRGLYRQHCVHCHGISGDGAGPTAVFLYPYPRDYRQGKFKFKSTEFSAKPTHEDLKRTLRDGINGTAMPSFTLLPNDELDALVEYVKYLSLRGEFELAMAREMFIQGEPADVELDRATLIEEFLTPAVEAWGEAGDKLINPAPRQDRPTTARALAASIEAGRKLFHGKGACNGCHGATAMGDGWADPHFDDWNNAKNAEEAQVELLPRQDLQPRNLRMGIYRGGRRPLDLYRRIHAGIPGAQMPGQGPGSGSRNFLEPDEIWQVVDYIRSLPYEPATLANRHEQVVRKAQN